jgi:hypothetical protein
MNEVRAGIPASQTGPIPPAAVADFGHIFSKGTYRSKCSAEHFDRLGIGEVHKHLANGDRDLHRWFEQYGIEAQSGK